MSLPVDASLPDLRAVLAHETAAVLAAPPGAGKTTRVPLALMDEKWVKGRKILLLSPRRVAARAAADRMASSLGEPVGRTVGFRVRFETKASAQTRIEVVTEGVFTRMLVADPELSGVAAVIFDEFHERSLEGDLGLALALDSQEGLRPDLRLLVMSATLDTDRVSVLLQNAPVIVSDGRMHPVALRYRGRDPRARLEDQMAAAAASALEAESGSLLCFLPGAREIERTADLLAQRLRPGGVTIHTLYGAMDPRAQDTAIAPARAGERKIVLATSIAETSLTIEGVRVVIDSGFSRRPRLEIATGLTRLETVRASRASVDQRAGRAGRTEPGVCWRLWDENENRALTPFDRPDILESDLTGLALDLAAWGVRDPASLRWLDPPPAAAWSQAIETLRELEALDGDGLITEQGARMADLPLHPRLAHMVARAAEEGRADTAARIALVLGDHGLGGRDVDLDERLRRFSAERSPRADAARRTARSIAQRVQVGGGKTPDDPGALLALAYPERVAKARGARGEFVMVNGRSAVLDETHPLAKAPYLAIAEASGRADRTQILLAAALQESTLIRLFGSRIEEAEEAFLDAAGYVRARRVRRLGRIKLHETPLERPSRSQVFQVIGDRFEREPEALDELFARERSAQFLSRVQLLRRLFGEAWPDLAAQARATPLEAWLLLHAAELRGLPDLTDDLVAAALEQLLDFSLRRDLQRLAPERFTTPAGGTVAIDYAAENGPAVDVRLQEMFGLEAHPSVAEGRGPILLRLLSPAGRPIQTTRDLPGFWRGSYAGVRADMRGRYPKHSWPEDPLTAAPTRRAKPKGS